MRHGLGDLVCCSFLCSVGRWRSGGANHGRKVLLSKAGLAGRWFDGCSGAGVVGSSWLGDSFGPWGETHMLFFYLVDRIPKRLAAEGLWFVFGALTCLLVRVLGGEMVSVCAEHGGKACCRRQEGE